ncbi:helix-turn-helix domain-containing protein [Flavobacteriaceae bacterium 14752]|uniref:helix-turn-helix domain-containing protein n=1 Tax=Mesohalobacter salilacus TaxID=2491711 RepID=UPI000F62D0BF|nr:XRE family transcriptional regulator [Flavobacteriaceae bacterium 14752]
MVNSKEFSERLEQIFKYYDLNASAFADKIDVGRASISHLLSGRNKPSLDFVMRVVKTFPEVELYWLLNGKGQFPEKEKKETEAQMNSKMSESESESKIIKTSNPLHPETKPNEDYSNSDIKRIVIFYKNGTFKSYVPN